MKKSLNLALSGGGARGLAMLPVLKILEEKQIPINTLSGSSMGGIIAVIYAFTQSYQATKDIIVEASKKITDISVKDKFSMHHVLFTQLKQADGLIDGEFVLNFAEGLTSEYGLISLKQLHYPVAVIAVDINTADLVVLSNHPEAFKREVPRTVYYDGVVTPAQMMVATGAVPLLISPIKLGSHRLVDGGLRLNIPAKILTNQDDAINLALRLDFAEEPDTPRGLKEIGIRAFDLQKSVMEDYMADEADYRIDIPVHANPFAFDEAEEIIDTATAYFDEHPDIMTPIFQALNA